MMEDDQYGREYAEGVDWTKGTVLGTGAYSTCYQARDVQTGTLMAAKQITFLRNSEEEQELVAGKGTKETGLETAQVMITSYL